MTFGDLENRSRSTKVTRVLAYPKVNLNVQYDWRSMKTLPTHPADTCQNQGTWWPLFAARLTVTTQNWCPCRQKPRKISILFKSTIQKCYCYIYKHHTHQKQTISHKALWVRETLSSLWAPYLAHSKGTLVFLGKVFGALEPKIGTSTL